MSRVELKHPELLAVTDEHGFRTVGGDQYWYPKEGFIPPGACGATTASNVLAYLLRSRLEMYRLAEAAGLEGPGTPISGACGTDGNSASPGSKAVYLEFMKKVYRFLYPRIGGLMVHEFLEGMAELADEYRLPIETEVLRVPIGRAKRPSYAAAAAFIGASLIIDIPVAFLILSGGSEENLDTWHWVTILAQDENEKRIQVLDNGEILWADLDLWLRTSIMGGSLVRLKINEK